ncbi:MAG: protein kinase [Bryobacteraceae bacterium]|nr:protein kinase [Bryobacteraceae bacterium]
MAPEKWTRVKDLFDSIADSDPSHRETLLRSIDDPEIRSEVERLLSHHEPASDSFSSLVRVPVSPRQFVQDFVRSRAFEPGQLLLGRFEIRTFLGAGGMGEVYEAFDHSLSELIAVKTIRSLLLNDAKVVQRFHWEVQRARRVSHPNVCRVHDLFTSNEAGREVHFLTMELLPGPTLYARVAEAPLAPPERLAYALQICRGLQAAHDAGLIHRDLKSANVILSGAPAGTRAVITDFGLAHPVEAAASPSQAAYHSYRAPGTLNYLAPEILRGAPASRRSDLYALGVILYRMAVRDYPRHRPHHREDARDAEDSRNPPDPRLAVPDLDDHWARTVLACLQPDPLLRPATAAEVAAQLDPSTRGVGASRRRLFRAAAIATFLVPAAALWRYRPPAPPPRLHIGDFPCPAAPAIGRTVASLFRLMLRTSKAVRLVPAPEDGALVLSGHISPQAAGYLLQIRLDDAGRSRAVERTAAGPARLSSAVLRAAVALELLPPDAPPPTVASLPLADLDTMDPEALADVTGGLSEYSSGNMDLALALLQRAVDRDPQFALAYVYRAIILSMLRRDDLSLADAAKAVALKARLSARLRPHAEAIYAYMCGDFHSSLARYAEVARLYPTEAPLHRHVSQSYTIFGQLKDAIHHARLAHELDPENAQGLMMLAAAYDDAGERANADGVLQAAARTIPNSVFLSIASGYSALIRNDCPRAVEAYEQVAVKAELQSFARAYQARALILAGRLDDAANRLKLRLPVVEQLRDRGHEDNYRYWLGQLAALTGDALSAADHASFLAARDASPISLNALRWAAEVSLAIRRADIARLTALKTSRIVSAYPSRRATAIQHQCAAIAAALEGNLDEAQRLIRQAEEFWEDIPIWWTAAEIDRERRHWSSALERLRKIIGRRSAALRFEWAAPWVQAHQRAALCSENLGESRAAAAYYDAFLGCWGSQTQLDIVRQCREARARLNHETGGKQL